MNGVSGCFGGVQPAANATIDSLEEVSAAVDGIVNGSDAPDGNAQAASVLAMHYACMEQRVRMLTWAVLALAAVVLLKEL